ncbi:MAG: hypothetical protein ACKOGE_07115, partial [Actinomycetota bacterium]
MFHIAGRAPRIEPDELGYEGETVDKSEALGSAVAQIEKQFGKGAIMRMGDMPLADIDYVPTG